MTPTHVSRRQRCIFEVLEDRVLPASFAALLTEEPGRISLGLGSTGWDLQARCTTTDFAGNSVDVEAAPAQVLFHADKQLTRPTGTQWDFLGIADGQPLWLIPQTPGAGENSLAVDGTRESSATIASYLETDPRINATGPWLKLSLRAVRGPAGGRFAVYQTAGTALTSWISTANGIGPDDVLVVQAGQQTSFSWAFTMPGFYEVDVQVTANRMIGGILTPLTSSTVTYHFGANNILGTEHADLDFQFSAGGTPAWTLQVRDEGNNLRYDPAQVILYGTTAARVTQPGDSRFDFLGAGSGNSVWVLPQTQDPSALYLGARGGAGGTFASYFESDPRVASTFAWVRYALQAVRGPGQFSVYQTDLSGNPTVWMSTFQGGVTAADSLFAPGGSHQHFNWAFTSRGTYEVDLQLSAFLGPGATNPTLSSTFTLTFQIEEPGALRFSTTQYTAAENGGPATVTVTRVGGDGAVGVQAATVVAGSTATASSDYLATTALLAFQDREYRKTFTVPILNDSLLEGPETINLALSNPTGGARLGLPMFSAIRINDDENIAPVAVADSYTVNEDTTLIVAVAQGVLQNDVDLDPLTALLVRNPANGTVTLNDNGSFTYRPASDFFGSDSFTYKANDGTTDGNTVTVSITVTAVNDRPSFTANAAPISLSEDSGPQALAGWATFNPGAANEADQTATYTASNVSNPALFAVAPRVAPDGTLTFTPAANAFGSTTFQVTVRDSGTTANGGIDLSLTQSFSIAIAAVNDAPDFTASDPPAVNENAGVVVVPHWATFNPGNAFEAFETATYFVGNISNPSLFALAPTVTSNGTLSYTPRASTFGSSTFEVVVQDNGSANHGGPKSSAPQSFTVTVRENSAPVAVADSYSISEDTTLMVAAAQGVLQNDLDLEPLSARLVSGPANGTLLLLGDGAFSYRPAADFFGGDSFTYKANDGNRDSNTVTVSITVTAVNDRPSFTANAAPISLSEDSGPQALAGWATFNPGAANEADQTATYTASNVSNPALFAVAPRVAPDGTLTFTPAANAFGSTTFQLTVRDNGTTANGGIDLSATQTFAISITGVNDVPSFTANGPPAVNEDAGAVVVPNWASFDPGNAFEAFESATYLVGNISNPALFSLMPSVAANGTLSYTPRPNAFGTSTFEVVVQDSGSADHGGPRSSAPQTFTVTVNAVNDPPDFLAIDPPPAPVNGGQQFVNNWATFNPGAPNETDQLPTYTVTVLSNATLFAVPPSVDANGRLSYTPAADRVGTGTFQVTVSDGGGGTEASAPRTFTITVRPNALTPSVTNATTLEDTLSSSGLQITRNPSNGAEVTHFKITNVSGGTLFLADGVTPVASGAYITAAQGSAGLRFLPTLDSVAQGRFNVQAATAAADVTLSPGAATATVSVTPVNDPPTFALRSDLVLGPNPGAQSFATFASNFRPGPMTASDEAVQSLAGYSAALVSLSGGLRFTVPPAIDAAGRLTFTPAPDAAGTAEVRVTARDTGPGTAPHANTSAPQTFRITVPPDVRRVGRQYADRLYRDTTGQALASDAATQALLYAAADAAGTISAAIGNVATAFLSSPGGLRALATLEVRHAGIEGTAAGNVDRLATLLARGLGDLAFVQAIFGSRPYYRQRGRGTNAGFLQALVRDLMGRRANPVQRRFLVDALNQGTSRAQMAVRLLQTSPAQLYLMHRYAQLYLRRPANSAELTAWSVPSVKELVLRIVTSTAYTGI